MAHASMLADEAWRAAHRQHLRNAVVRFAELLHQVHNFTHRPYPLRPAIRQDFVHMLSLVVVPVPIPLTGHALPLNTSPSATRSVVADLGESGKPSPPAQPPLVGYAGERSSRPSPSRAPRPS